MSNDDRLAEGAKPESRPGPFLARVVSITDPYYMGTLEVELLHESGNDNAREGQVHQVKYLSPFAGSTSVAYVDENDEYNSTQKSYGMWMVPPDIGNTVVVIFIDGDPRRGFWIGCVLDPNVNFMIPGYAATSFNLDGDKSRTPVAEYNKKTNDISAKDTTRLLKPFHPFLQDRYLEQGLLEDDIRGITTSSARREIPSAVFGISTPGPIDKKGPRGKVGKFEHAANEAFISRIGGSSFVMDDGDDKFLRKTSPSEGPPEYAAVEQDETDGDVYRPHNELLRFRTRTGHQILLHNTEDLIYIGNARGTSWIEMTSDGKIDIFAEDSVSIRTKQDLNFYATRDINMECGRNFNTKVNGEMHTHVIKDQILIVDENQKIHVKQNVDKTYEQQYTHHVKQDVNKLYDQNYLQHVLANVDKVFDGSLKTKIGASEDKSVASSITVSSGSGHQTTAGGAFEVKASGTNIDGGQIHLNSGNFGGSSAADATVASEAELPQRLKLHTLANETGEVVESDIPPSIMRRIPTIEPYPYHENLDPLKVKPAETDRDINDRYEDTDGEQTAEQSSFSETMSVPADYWKKYTTGTDTFAKISGASEI